MASKIISLLEAYKRHEDGDDSLFSLRYSQGNENDINEFSSSIERYGLNPITPFEMDFDSWVQKSKMLDSVVNSITDARNSARTNDARLQPQTTLPDVVALRQHVNKTYAYTLLNEDAVDDERPLDIVSEMTAAMLSKSQKWDPITKLLDSTYITTNTVTVLETSFTSNVNLKYLHRTMRLGQVIEMISGMQSLLQLSKDERPQLYYSTRGTRPTAEEYYAWNGVQVFDIDLKNSATPNAPENAALIKQQLFDTLKHYKWLVAVCLSTSGRGIHVYTKVARPHAMYVNPSDNNQMSRFWYQTSYRQKLSAIKYVLENVCKIDVAWGKRKSVIDFAVARITQGIKISYDPKVLINPDFEDIHPSLGLHIPPVPNITESEWLTTSDIVSSKQLNNWKAAYSEVAVSTQINRDDFTLGEFTPSEIKGFDGEVHYQLRYHVCNTLADIFGESGRKYAHTILKSRACANVSEIEHMYNHAVNSHKSMTNYGIQILRKCGVPITFTAVAQKTLEEDTIQTVENLIAQAVIPSGNETHDARFDLKAHEYLGDIHDALMNTMRSDCVNLIDAPPGTGKTEWVKRLSQQSRVLLVLPYISVIDAKIDKDKNFAQHFDSYYGDKRVSQIKKGRSAVMTIDKFSTLDAEQISYMFDYVVIDESHLMFTSSYRIETMSNALKVTKDFLAMSTVDEYAAKVILMTGTPTGEAPYFSFYRHLHYVAIRKEEKRTKSVNIMVCANTDEMQCRIAIHIAKAINSGKRVIYPTNDGNIQAVKLVGMVNHHLRRPVKWGYYKKANSERELSVSINNDATVSDYELILASNYLSVGIDINDNDQFECIYDNTFAGYEIEQFNCRLRNVDIESTVYLSCHNASGEVLPNITNTSPYSLTMYRVDRDLVRDHLDIANKKVELSIAYDPITNRISTPGFKIENGQMVFKLEEHELVMFEERYLESMRCPYWVAKMLTSYNYILNILPREEIDATILDETISIGLECAHAESLSVNAKSIHSMHWILDNDTMQIGDATIDNLVDKIWKEPISVQENLDISEPYAITTFLGGIESIQVPSKQIFEEQLVTARKLLATYCPETAKYLFDSCIIYGKNDSMRINKSEVARYTKLLSLVRADERGTLAREISKVIKSMYEYVEQFYHDESIAVPQENHDAKIDTFATHYLELLNLNLRTDKMLARYRTEVNELFTALTSRHVTKTGVRFKFRLMPQPDNALMKKRKEFDSTLQKIFNISMNAIPDSISEMMACKHIPADELRAANQVASMRFNDDGSVISRYDFMPNGTIVPLNNY